MLVKHARLCLSVLLATFVWSMSAAELIMHVDLNSVQLRRSVISEMLKVGATNGYTAVIWEIEDKVRLTSCPEVVSAEAMSKEDFRALLLEAKSLGIRSIPLLQTFGHAEYVLKTPKFKSLRETQDRHDCYCVSKKATREFQRKLLMEYLELFNVVDVKWFHLGGDECFVFGSCPDCAMKRAVEIYADHLNYLAEPLRARGIRPCIWGDMIVNDSWKRDIDLLPKDFIVFHWDYYLGHNPKYSRAKELLPFLIEHGFSVVFAAASSCGGDGPFMPDLCYHRHNIAAGREKVRIYGLAGLCITSWSIRQSPKRMQFPLLEFAGSGRWTLPAEYDALTRWSPDLCDLDGRGWHNFKDATVPPPGQLSRVLAKKDKEDPLFRKHAITVASEIRAGVAAALPCVMDKWKEGGELELKILDCMLAALRNEPVPVAPFESSVRYLSEEQTSLSATNSASIIWGLYQGGVTCGAGDGLSKPEERTARKVCFIGVNDARGCD